MSRYRACGIHLLICMLVGLTLLALCWFVWYPAPMLMAIGGHEIFLLIVGIDVIVGPLLTLTVFNPRKNPVALKVDLLLIACLQVAAMTYGVRTLLEARPAFVAALGDKFQVVLATEIPPESLAKANMHNPWWGPVWVGTREPKDKADVSLVQSLASIGAGRGHVPQLHVPYSSMRDEVLQKARSIADLKKLNTEQVAEIDVWLAKHGYTDQTVKYQPIQIRASEFAVILDAKSAAVIGISPFVPGV